MHGLSARAVIRGKRATKNIRKFTFPEVLFDLLPGTNRSFCVFSGVFFVLLARTNRSFYVFSGVFLVGLLALMHLLPMPRREWFNSNMGNLVKSLILLMPMIGCIYLSIVFHVRSEPSLSLLFGVVVLVNFGMGLYLGYLENMKAMFWAMASSYGVYWSTIEMISTIDFDAPFLTSFYWSTVGYFMLSVALIPITLFFLKSAASDPEKI